MTVSTFSQKKIQLCPSSYVIGMLLDFGIGILSVITPSTYFAVPMTFSSSLIENGNGNFFVYVVRSLSVIYGSEIFLWLSLGVD